MKFNVIGEPIVVEPVSKEVLMIPEVFIPQLTEKGIVVTDTARRAFRSRAFTGACLSQGFEAEQVVIVSPSALNEWFAESISGGKFMDYGILLNRVCCRFNGKYPSARANIGPRFAYQYGNLMELGERIVIAQFPMAIERHGDLSEAVFVLERSAESHEGKPVLDAWSMPRYREVNWLQTPMSFLFMRMPTITVQTVRIS